MFVGRPPPGQLCQRRVSFGQPEGSKNPGAAHRASFRLPLPHGAHDPGGRHHERVQALPLTTPLSATLRTRRWLLAHENNKEDQIKEDLK